MRGQAATEFLVTYGWGFVLVITALSGIIALDPIGYIGTGAGVSTCTVSSPLNCDADRMTVDVEDESVQFSLTASGGEGIRIGDINFPEMSDPMDTTSPTVHNVSGLFPTDSWVFKGSRNDGPIRAGFHKRGDWYYHIIRGGKDFACDGIDSWRLYGAVWRVNKDFDEAEMMRNITCVSGEVESGITFFNGAWWTLDPLTTLHKHDENWNDLGDASLDPDHTGFGEWGIHLFDDLLYVVDDHRRAAPNGPNPSIDVYYKNLTHKKSIDVSPLKYITNFYKHDDLFYIAEGAPGLEDNQTGEVHVVAENGSLVDVVKFPRTDIQLSIGFFYDRGRWYFAGGPDELDYVSYPAPHCTANEVITPGERLEFDCNVAGAMTGSLAEGQTYRWPIEVEYYSVRRGEEYEKTVSGTLQFRT